MNTNQAKTSTSKYRRYFAELLQHEGFRSAPFAVGYRAILYMVYRLLGMSPTFRLTKGGPFLQVALNQGRIGSGSAFVLRDRAEPELHYLQLLLNEGDVFVDCGANIGVFTLKAASIVGVRGMVIAIEPGHDSAARLEKNIDLNGFAQVRVVRKALAEKCGVANLYHTGGGPVAFSLIASNSAVDSEEVEITTLDTLIGSLDLKRFDCFKIDVEGAESQVIRGGLESIRKYLPKIIFEINSAGTKRSGRPADEVWDLLSEVGYSFFLMRDGKLSRLSAFPSVNGNVVAIAGERQSQQ